MSNSSRPYGPVQVRDLSEHWGQVKLKIASREQGHRGCAVRQVNLASRTSGRAMSPVMELPLDPYPRGISSPQRHTFHCSPSFKDVAPNWIKRKPRTAWTGALHKGVGVPYKGVRGSIPSSVIRSMTTAPVYKTSESSGQTQPLNKLTVENST